MIHFLGFIALIGAIFYLYEQSSLFNGVIGGVFKGIKYLVITGIAISLLLLAIVVVGNLLEEDKPVPAPQPVADYSACKSGEGHSIAVFMDCAFEADRVAGRKR